MPVKLEAVDGVPEAPRKKKYVASIWSRTAEVEPDLATLVLELERQLERKIWLLVHSGEDERWDQISEEVYHGFRDKKNEILSNEKVGLLIHSPGGQASYAYQIARLFQRRTGDFLTIVPCYAKSAATLMAIGGSQIMMGSEAELGPLDVQVYDGDKEEWGSALNAVQSLERLNAYALSAFDQAMLLLASRTRKKSDSLMPLALKFATSIVKPLVEKIDTIDLTRKSRELKVAEDYAIRLMRGNYSRDDAARIASNLVARYSTHGFVIDSTEAGKEGASSGNPINLGLNVTEAAGEIEALFTKLVPQLERTSIIGKVMEKGSEQEDGQKSAA